MMWFTTLSTLARFSPLFCEEPAKPNLAVAMVDRFSESWWKERFEKKAAELATATPEVVFLGDSITQGWEGKGQNVWHEKISPLKAFNLGYSGDRTEHVLWRIDHGEFDRIKPKLIVILIGTNNVGHGSSTAAQTIEGMRRILARLEEKQPQAKILIQAVFPRADKPLQGAIDEMNKGYEALADQKNIFFIDFSKKFLNAEGQLTREIMPDLLHLSATGYEIWAKSVLGKIAELLAMA
jgi:lysophospholipase L1-like esterase